MASQMPAECRIRRRPHGPCLRAAVELALLSPGLGDGSVSRVRTAVFTSRK